MQPVPDALGNQRYQRLQELLASPLLRAQQVLAVTAADWWPDGAVPQTRRAAQRMVRQRHPRRERHPS